MLYVRVRRRPSKGSSLEGPELCGIKARSPKNGCAPVPGSDVLKKHSFTVGQNAMQWNAIRDSASTSSARWFGAAAVLVVAVVAVAKPPWGHVAEDLVPSRREARDGAYRNAVDQRGRTVNRLLILLTQIDKNRKKLDAVGADRFVKELHARIEKPTTPDEKEDLENQLRYFDFIKDDEHREGEGRECYVIRLLGEYRAPEAVEPLLDRIDGDFWRRINTEVEGPEERPVIRALVSIGKPASVGALKRLATEESTERAARFLRVMELVEGRELAREMIRLAAVKEKNAERKARLKAAMERLTAIAGRPPEDADPRAKQEQGPPPAGSSAPLRISPIAPAIVETGER
ncbi:MAG: hypothetical protein K2R98_26185 [Gemmataceae bacterium]|nr:hypothetical protein [Gemmataceae bacterium]